MARTLPTDGVSPCDFYAHTAPIKALGHFQWDLTSATVPAADAMLMLDLNDATTATSGTIRGLYIDVDVSGLHASGSKWIKCIETDMNITDDYFRYIVGLNIGWSITSGKDAKNNYGIYMYFDSIGTGTVDAMIPLGIDRNTADGYVAGDWDCFARFVTHGDGKVTSIFCFEGVPYIADYLFDFEHPSIPITAAATGGSNTHYAKVLLGTLEGRIPIYTG